MGTEITCSDCSKKTQINTMRYSRDGSGLICQDCGIKQGTNRLKITPNPFTKKPELVPKKKIVYVCKACNYRFTRAVDFTGPKICPYCGKNTVIYDLPNHADDLLRELDKLDI